MVSVVIPAFNEEKSLPRCLDQFAKQAYKGEFEVIVVDNNSTDNTTSVAESYNQQFPLRVIHEKTKGRGPARKAGFDAAKGDIILSTDADTLVPTDWIEQLVKGLQAGDCAAVTGMCKVEDLGRVENKIMTGYQPIGMFLYKLAFGHYWMSGYNFGIKKEVYEKAGEFNGSLNGQEDTDLTFRVAKLGKIKLVKEATVSASGRRFKKGIIHGHIAYFRTYIQYFIFRKPIIFTDPR